MVISVYQIIRDLKSGEIEYNSESVDTWTVKEKSQFIESCWMGLPVMNDLVILQLNDKRIILHGNKRIRALQEYINNSFRLEGLKIMKQLNGKSFEELTGNLAVYHTQLTDMYIEETTVKKYEYGKDFNIYEIRDRMNMERKP